jgi:hypothetical protein
MDTLYRNTPAAWGLEHNLDTGSDNGLASWSKRLLAENAELLNDLGKLSPGASWWKSVQHVEPQPVLDDGDDLAVDPEADLPI